MRRQWSLLKGFLEPRTSWKSSISGLVSEPYIALWACLPDSYCTLLYTLTYVHAMFSVSHTHTHNRFTALFRDHPGELVPEENFWTSWCKERLTETDTLTLTIQLGATPSGLTSAHLHHPPHIFLQAGCPSCHPTNSVKALKAASAFGLGRRR